MRFWYSLLLYLATPLMLLYLAWRGLRDAGYWARWGERFALYPALPRTGAIVFHCASVGEVNAASPLVNAVLANYPDRPVLVTAFTPTGARRAEELFGDRVAHRHTPIDLPGCIRRYFRRNAPSLLVVVETEVWPNLYRRAERLGVPLLMVNARLSTASVRQYQRFPSLFGAALRRARAILAQSETDRQRFEDCGADPDHLHDVGNLKFDVEVPAHHHEAGELLRTGWGVNRPVLAAGSTHEDDETVLLDAFARCLPSHPDALLILAPRHPERFARAAQLARDARLRVATLSEDRRVQPDTQCFIVDTMGELLNFYAAADVTFLGGTLAPIGGHNILEPAALGKPVITGPERANVADIAQRLIDGGGAIEVRNAADLSLALDGLFTDGAQRDRMGQAALALVASGRGALERTLSVMDSALGR